MGALLAAIVFGYKAPPAWAAPVLKKEKREMLWDWYRASGLKCIGEHEGAWTDDGYPYWGRFQMGMPFQAAYGRHYGKGISYLRRFGTADQWTKTLQIHAAKHGWYGQGKYTAWPLTSRECGL